MATISDQSPSQIIFVNTMQSTYLEPVPNINAAGYQLDQVQAVQSLKTLDSNEQVAFKFAVGYPAPLLTLAGAINTVVFKIFTNDSALLLPESVKASTSVPLNGFNGVQWQPGPGESYTIVMRNIGLTAIVVNSPLLYFQCTIQNTLSQYLPETNITLSNSTSDAEAKRGAPKTVISITQITNFNSTSSQFNCYVVDVQNFPVRRGLTVSPVNVMPLKTGVMLFGVCTGNGSIASGPAGYEDLQVIANSTLALSTRQIAPSDGTWSGTLYFGFTNVGITTQFPTLAVECALPMFDTMLTAMERNNHYSPATNGSTINPLSMMSGFSGTDNPYGDRLDCLEVKIDKLMDVLCKHIASNAAEFDAIENEMSDDATITSTRRPSGISGLRGLGGRARHARG